MTTAALLHKSQVPQKQEGPHVTKQFFLQHYRTLNAVLQQERFHVTPAVIILHKSFQSSSNRKVQKGQQHRSRNTVLQQEGFHAMSAVIVLHDSPSSRPAAGRRPRDASSPRSTQASFQSSSNGKNRM